MLRLQKHDVDEDACRGAITNGDSDACNPGNR